MGLFSGIKKAVKGAVKGFSKVLGKVVKGVAKLGKGIVRGVGKIMGKMGPIGTMAIGFIAPYALSAVAAGGFGWASTAAQGVMNAMNTVKSVVGAPFSFAKDLAGQGFSTITDKLGSTLGQIGGNITDGASKIFSGITDAGKQALGMTQSPLQAGMSSFGEGATLGFQGAGEATTSLFESQALGQASPTSPSLLGFEGSGASTAVTRGQAADMITPDFQSISREQQLSGVTDPNKSLLAPEAPSSSMLGDLLKKGLDMFGGGMPQQQGFMTPATDISGYDVESAGVGSDRGRGGTGQSFSGQTEMGFLDTDELARRQAGFMGLA